MDPANKEKLSNYLLVTVEAKNKKLDGNAFLKELTKDSDTKVGGYPFLAVTNPKTGKIAFINTGDLEANTETTKGHDAAKVFGAIQAASK